MVEKTPPCNAVDVEEEPGERGDGGDDGGCTEGVDEGAKGEGGGVTPDRKSVV